MSHGTCVLRDDLEATCHGLDVAGEFGIAVAGGITGDGDCAFPIVDAAAAVQFLIGKEGGDGEVEGLGFADVDGDFPCGGIDRAAVGACPCAGDVEGEVGAGEVAGGTVGIDEQAAESGFTATVEQANLTEHQFAVIV